MKYFLALVFSFFCYPLFADQKDSVAAPGILKKISIGITLSPNYSYRNLYVENPDTNSNWIKDMRNRYEEGKFGYSAGIILNYNLSQHWSVGGGLQYSNRGFRTKVMSVQYSVIDPRYNFIYETPDENTPNGFGFIYTYEYLDCPIRLIYNFGNKRLHFRSSVGILGNFLLNSNI